MTSRRRSVSAALVLAVVAAASSIVGRTARANTPLKVIVFPGGQAWPLWVADEHGFFAREGLAVETTFTPGSVFMMTRLIAGEFDIAITNIDNVIAYDEGQGEAAVGGTPDLFAFIGGNTGLLTLYAAPEIGTYADLRGKVLAVDAVTTGYAFVLRAMLAHHGLADSDYRLEPVGGTAARWSALQQRRYAATMLNPHFDALASAAGFRLLGKASDVLPAYQGLVGSARRNWAQNHRDDLVRFIRAYAASVKWLCDPAHKSDAVEMFRRHVPGTSAEIAGVAYDEEFASTGGFHEDLALDAAGIETVLTLRRTYAQPKKELGPPDKYYDLSYYRSALGR